MSNQAKYLLTVDTATGAAVKLERLGEAGDLTEVPVSMLRTFMPTGSAAAQPPAPPTVVNIYVGGLAQEGVTFSVQPAPGATPVGPGAPGGPGGPGVSLVGPGAPGGPGGPGAPGVSRSDLTQ